MKELQTKEHQVRFVYPPREEMSKILYQARMKQLKHSAKGMIGLYVITFAVYGAMSIFYWFHSIWVG